MHIILYSSHVIKIQSGHAASLQQPNRVCMGMGLAPLTMAFHTPSRFAHWNIEDGKEQKSVVKWKKEKKNLLKGEL